MTRRASASGLHRDHFRSTDVTEIEGFLRSNYTDTSIRTAGSGLELGHDAVVGDGFGLNHLWTTLALRSRVGPMQDDFVVGHVRDGSVVWNSDAFGAVHTGPGCTSVAPPVGEVENTVEHVDLDVVTLDTDRMQRYVEHVYGIDPESFRVVGLTPLSNGHRRRWNETVAYVRDDMLGNPVLADNPIVLDEAFRALARAFLVTFPTTAPTTFSRRHRVPERALRDVTDYLRAHAGEPVGPADLVAAAALPVGDVTDALRRRHDTHPSVLLWEARLRGARAELVEAAPDDGVTVAGIAGRWGFTHAGRFRTAYAQAFGELPESTLHRP